MSSQWTANDIPDQSGKVAIVTGANSGIGYETALALAKNCAQVVLACRSAQKGQVAEEAIRREVPNAQVTFMPLDLASLKSVWAFAEAFLAQYQALHILVNNAGVMALPERHATADGFEMQFGTNHLGHFALTGLLIDRMMQTGKGRVISVSSFAHYYARFMGGVNFDNLNAERGYNRWYAYCLSKLANLLFTVELQGRLAAVGADVIAAAAHPGWTRTNLQKTSGFFSLLNPYFSQLPPMGALPTLYAATAPDVRGGDYYGPDGFMGMRGYPTKASSSRAAQDMAVAKRLWEESAKLTGVTYTFARKRSIA